MTSEARLAANRRNAARSTGPRTAAGKAASSRNARRHDLTSPPPRQATAPVVAAGAAAIAADAPLTGAAAARAAELAVHLGRVRDVKRQAVERAQAALTREVPAPEPEMRTALALLAALPELLVLDEYERKALSRLRRVLNQT